MGKCGHDASRLWTARWSVAAPRLWMRVDAKLDQIRGRLEIAMKRKKMTPDERQAYEEQKAAWAKNSEEFRAMVARREQRLREGTSTSPAAAPASAASRSGCSAADPGSTSRVAGLASVV